MNHRVVLAEDNFLVREGVRGMLSATGSVEVVATCGDLAEALEAIDRLMPDVVLTDIRMPPDRRDEGIVIAAHCCRHHPTMGVVLLSQYAEASYVRTLLTAAPRAAGTCSRNGSPTWTTCWPPSTRSPPVVRPSTRRWSKPSSPEGLWPATATSRGDSDIARLTPRERQVLACIAQGRTNAAVANELFLAQHAVEKHINAIFTKLGLSGDRTNHPRVRATLMYLAEGQR